MRKVLIAGSREITEEDFNYIVEFLNEYFLDHTEDIVVVCGGARGVDTLGKLYAREEGFKVKDFPAMWHKYGRSAGFIRNEEMALYADEALIFWDGISKGTENMISLCKKHEIPHKVELLDGQERREVF